MLIFKEARIIYNRHTKFIQEAIGIDLTMVHSEGTLPIFDIMKEIINSLTMVFNA